MQRFRHTVPAPELVLASIGVALLLGALWFASELSRLAPDIKSTQAALRHLADLRAHASDVQAAARGYLLTNERWYLEPARDATAAIDDDIQILSRLLVGGEFADRFDALAKLVRSSVDKSRLLVTTRDADGLSAALRVVRSDEDHRVMEEVRARAASLQLDMRTALTRDRSTRDATVEWLVTHSVAMTVLLCIALPLCVRGARDRIELQRYRQAFDRLRGSGAIGISLWNAQGHMIEANDEFLRIFGRSRDRLPRSPHWSSVIGPEHGRAVSASSLDLSSTGVCKPFLLAPEPGGHSLPSLVWSVLADDEQHLVASFALEVEGVLAAAVAATERGTFCPLVRNVKLPVPEPLTPLEAAPSV